MERVLIQGNDILDVAAVASEGKWKLGGGCSGLGIFTRQNG